MSLIHSAERSGVEPFDDLIELLKHPVADPGPLPRFSVLLLPRPRVTPLFGMAESDIVQLRTHATTSQGTPWIFESAISP